MTRAKAALVGIPAVLVAFAGWALAARGLVNPEYALDPTRLFPSLLRDGLRPHLLTALLLFLAPFFYGALAVRGPSMRSGLALRLAVLAPIPLALVLSVLETASVARYSRDGMPSHAPYATNAVSTALFLVLGAVALSLRAAGAGAPRVKSGGTWIAGGVSSLGALLWVVMNILTRARGGPECILAVTAGVLGGLLLPYAATGARAGASDDARAEATVDVTLAAIAIASAAFLAAVAVHLDLTRTAYNSFACSGESAKRLQDVALGLETASSAATWTIALTMIVAVVAVVALVTVRAPTALRRAAIPLGLMLALVLASASLGLTTTHRIAVARVADAQAPCPP